MFSSGSPVRCAISKSVGSCAGVTFTAPVPNVGIDGVVGDDREVTSVERVPHRLPDQVSVPIVVGMHRDPRVAQHRLDPRRRDLDMAGAVGERVPEGEELPVDLLVLDLGVGQTRLVRRAPVDQPLAAVDQPLLVQRTNATRTARDEPLVHREALPIPVERAPMRLSWPMISPPYCSFHSQTRSTNASRPRSRRSIPSFAQLALDHDLGGDAGVVHPGHPERLAALASAPGGSRRPRASVRARGRRAARP